MNLLGETLSYSIFLIKLILLWYKQRTFDRILTMMAIDWEKCYSAKFSMFAMTCNAKLSRRFTNMTVVLYSMAVIFHSSNIVMKHTNDDEASNTSTRPLLTDMDLPFNYNRAYVYELIIIIQFLHVWLSSCAIGLLNALLINLILHVGGQINILCEWLMEMFPKREAQSEFFYDKKIIKKHQQIITFSEYIEDLYSNIAMVLFVSDTFIICCLGFVMVASVGTPDAAKIIMRTLLFYFVMNMEAFVFCFAGEYLSTKSDSIGDAAYNSFWYESNSKDSRIILFVIMKSQRQLTITIGKTMNLSLQQFSSIVKASASYISVLLAMN
ncbi:LOW QUALITY PROTEIN: odorant receptor 4-like [Nylanderia fulva]|uniref:LOW QUALITY PROTEIN: odorant receptor 4-like n=1 Tax=Nylanderia fulva TaxID=613905 RepID=UPI0010FBB3BF|nr:LOW QUALITY PROTEIN: odorant receptor 4-like [Nylanderia fulva]